MHEFELWQAKKAAKSEKKHSVPMQGKPLRPCKHCKKTGHYSYRCFQRPDKPKPISKKGKRTIAYEAWRDSVARPYLDKTFGHRCVDCGAVDGLDVAHIRSRGSRPDLKMNLDNVCYKCRVCHQKESGIFWK